MAGGLRGGEGRPQRIGTRLLLLGYSAGCYSVNILVDELREHGVSVDAMILLDPAFTSSANIQDAGARLIATGDDHSPRRYDLYGDRTQAILDAGKQEGGGTLAAVQHLGFVMGLRASKRCCPRCAGSPDARARVYALRIQAADARPR